MGYGNETRLLLADVGLKFERADMQMIRWVCSVSMKDRKRSEKHQVNKCMEIRIESERPVGRPRETW